MQQVVGALIRWMDEIGSDRPATTPDRPEVRWVMMLAVPDDDETDAAGPGKASVLLGRAEVGALVDACGLGQYREPIVDAVLAGYRLEPGGDGRTRIGGLPDTADGEIWPHADNGIAYTLVAQVTARRSLP
jgi:hypothetical protein